MNLITQGIIQLFIGLGIGVLLNQTFRFERKRSNHSKEQPTRELRNYTIQKGSLKWMIDREFKKRNQLKN